MTSWPRPHHLIGTISLWCACCHGHTRKPRTQVNKHVVLTLTPHPPSTPTPNPFAPPPSPFRPPTHTHPRGIDFTASHGELWFPGAAHALSRRRTLLPVHSLTPDPPPSPGSADRRPLPPALDAGRRGVLVGERGGVARVPFSSLLFFSSCQSGGQMSNV